MEESLYASLYSESPADSYSTANRRSPPSGDLSRSLSFDIEHLDDTFRPPPAAGAYGWQHSIPNIGPTSGLPANMISSQSEVINDDSVSHRVEHDYASVGHLEEPFPFSEYTTIWSPQPAFRASQPSHMSGLSSLQQQQVPGQANSFRPSTGGQMQPEDVNSAQGSSNVTLNRSFSSENTMPTPETRSRSRSQSSNSLLSPSYHDHDNMATRSSAFGPAQTLTEEEKKKRNRESSQRFRNRTRERQNAMKNRMHYLEDKVRMLERALDVSIRSYTAYSANRRA